MRALAIAAVLVTGCTRVPPPAAPSCPEPVEKPVVAASPAEPPAPARPAVPDETAVIADSHAFMDTYDRFDVEAFTARVGPTFVRFESARSYDQAHLVQRLTAGRGRGLTPRTRTCTNERVYRNAGVIVYLGECVESVPAAGARPATHFEGWNTLVWAPHDGAWKVAHWGWQKAGLEAEREMWNDTYRRGGSFKQTANQLLIDTVAKVKPGTALDVAMGQGRNAVYLASSRWKVTGIDISDEGLRIAKENAAQQNLKLDAVQADIDTYDFGRERWDLVTLIYAGSSPALIARIQPSLRKGGLFVVEFFHKEATAGTGIGGFASGELARQFGAGWTILKDEVVEDIADWGLRKTKLVRFVARKN